MTPYNNITKFQAESFVSPRDENFPVYSWIWNDALTEEGIAEKLKYFSSHNMKNIYVIPISKDFRPQNMPSYLSPHYMEADYLKLFHYAVKEGKKQGVNFWLYDEDAWPSASCCGQVVKSNPELAQKIITRNVVTLDEDESCNNTDKGFLAAFHKGIRISLPFSSTEKTSLEIYRMEEQFPYNNPYPDLLDARSADAFLELTHEKYAEEFGDDFAALLPFMFIDEPNLPRNPWTPLFPEEFKEQFGYDILDFLPAIFSVDESHRASVQARIDYRSCIASLLIKNFYNKISSWCKEHNVYLTGHADGDDTLVTYFQNGDLLPVLREFDVPGIDVIVRQIFPEKERDFKLDFNDFVINRPIHENKFFPRMAASAARQNGSSLALTESFSVYGSGLTFEQMRYIVHFQAVRGINVFNFMNTPCGGTVKLLTGLRPTFDRHMPAQEELTSYNAYLSRLSYLMRLGHEEVCTALYVPAQDVFADGEIMLNANNSYEKLGNILEQKHITFDLIDNEVISAAPIGSQIKFGLAEYSTVIVPECKYMPDNIKAKLAQLAEAGVEVIGAESALSRAASQSNSLSLPDNSNIRYMRRITDDAVIYFLYNEGLSSENTTVTFREEMPAYSLNLSNGEIYLAESAVNLSLNSGEAAVFIFTEHQLDAKPDPMQGYSDVPDVVLDTFEFRTTKQTVISKERIWVTTSDAPDLTVTLPAVKSPVDEDFSGQGVYRADFCLNDIASAILIDLGRVCYSCRIVLNGQDLGCLLAPPYRLYADPSILQAVNHLEIYVSNTLANQLVHTSAFQEYDVYNIGTYHYMEIEFEKETCDFGLYNPVKIYCRPSS